MKQFTGDYQGVCDIYCYAENQDIRVRVNLSQASDTIQYQSIWHDEPDEWHGTIFQSADVLHEDDALKKVDAWLESNSQS